MLLTDREDLALECALRSAEANGLSVRNLEQPADIQDEADSRLFFAANPFSRPGHASITPLGNILNRVHALTYIT